MTQELARASENVIFKTGFLPFTEIPNQSRLFLDFLADANKIQNFYPEKNASLKDFSAKVADGYKINRKELCRILKTANESFGAGGKTFENIELLSENDCFAVVTGQQTGLLSGALYTIYKAVSAIKLAARLKSEGVKAVPIFWLAEEDHDFDEVKKTFSIDKNGKIFTLENTPESYRKNQPVGEVALDDKISATLEDLFDEMPQTEFSGNLKENLEKSYRRGETFSTSFAKFLQQLFADYGLIILAPLNAELKKLCAPVFTELIKKSDEIRSDLLAADKKLASENYHSQVLVEENFFPFFLIDENGDRAALKKTNKGNYKTKISAKEYSLAELTEIAREFPEKLSPNALTRPIVQDFLLPTITYFGGAAEIAYFAQNSAIYKLLKRPATPIKHRASLTVVEKKHARNLEKYDLKFSDLFDGEEQNRARVVEKFLANDTAQIFSQVETKIDQELKTLKNALAKSDATLAAHSANRTRKIFYHLDALRKKFHRVEILKNEIAERRIGTLFDALVPHKALQERTLNVSYFLNSYGQNFVEWIYEAAEIEGAKHQILYFR